MVAVPEFRRDENLPRGIPAFFHGGPHVSLVPVQFCRVNQAITRFERERDRFSGSPSLRPLPDAQAKTGISNRHSSVIRDSIVRAIAAETSRALLES